MAHASPDEINAISDSYWLGKRRERVKFNKQMIHSACCGNGNVYKEGVLSTQNKPRKK